MKKLISLILCTLTLFSLAACGSKSTEKDNTQIPNPFVDCNTLADAAKLAGFDFIVPDTIDGYTERTIQAVDKSMIQVIYSSGEDKQLMLRKGAGSEDISGDYNTYAETNTVSVGTLKVTMKGENSLVSVATWTDGDHAYAVEAQTNPISSDAMSKLIAGIR